MLFQKCGLKGAQGWKRPVAVPVTMCVSILKRLSPATRAAVHTGTHTTPPHPTQESKQCAPRPAPGSDLSLEPGRELPFCHRGPDHLHTSSLSPPGVSWLKGTNVPILKLLLLLFSHSVVSRPTAAWTAAHPDFAVLYHLLELHKTSVH